MDLLVLVTTSDAHSILVPLGHACARQKIRWAVFFTNDGVKNLQDEAVVGSVESGQTVIACQDSWNHHLPNVDCPVELGSQTNNSAFIAQAEHIVSI